MVLCSDCGSQTSFKHKMVIISLPFWGWVHNAWHGLKTQIKQIERMKRIKEKRGKNGLHERMEKKSIIRRSLVNREWQWVSSKGHVKRFFWRENSFKPWKIMLNLNSQNCMIKSAQCFYWQKSVQFSVQGLIMKSMRKP